MDCQKVCSKKYLILIIVIVFLIFSCASTKDITNNDVLRGNYTNGVVLKSKKDMLLDKYNYLWDLERDVEKAKMFGIPSDYKGMFEMGTKIKILRIELYRHIENGNYIYPIGLVLNGKWKGEEVNLYYASVSSNDPANDSHCVDIKDIDTELFEIVIGENSYENSQ